MRSRSGVVAGVLAGLTLLTAGCTSSAPGYVSATPQLSLDPGAPCPHTLGAARDVENRGSGLSHRLVPKDAPSGGLICAYKRPDTTETAGNAPSLYRQVRLTATDATAMTRELPLVSLDPIRATYSCGGGPGQAIVIAFSYPHRPAVSLWYDDSGCRRLDNGHLLAEGAGHPSFYDHFAKQVEALLR